MWGSLIAALGGYGGYNYIYKPYKLSQQEVLRPETQKTLAGAFLNGYADLARIQCFEKMAGHKLAIVERFTNFQELRTNQPFPMEAGPLKDHGITLFMVLEPGSGKKPSDITFPIKQIPSGDFDKYLTAFGKGAHNYGGPVMLTFRPWHGLKTTHEENLLAYRYIREKIISTGARNLTWVWTVNLDDQRSWELPPLGNEMDWLAVTAYEEEGLNKLKAHIAELKKLGKPILVEYGSRLQGQAKADFLRKAEAFFREWEIEAFVLNNVSQFEEGVWKPWTITLPEERTGLRESFTSLPLAKGVRTREGVLEDKTKAPLETTNCSEFEGRYYDVAQAHELERIKNDIADAKTALQHSDHHYDNMQYIKLAKAYRDYYSYTRNVADLEMAERTLEKALKNPDPAVTYHPRIDYVRDYLEILLQVCEAMTLRDSLRASEYAHKIIAFLHDHQLRYAQQIRDESIDGYTARTFMIEARALEFIGRNRDARELYLSIIKWAEEESSRNYFMLLWRGEKRDKVRYIGTSAQIQLGFIALRENHLSEALSRFKSVITWSKVGREKGFMDLGYKALVGILLYCAQSSDDPAQIKLLFEGLIDWQQFNKYTDLKKSLLLEKIDLHHPQKIKELGTDRLQLILDGLQNVTLPEDLAKGLSVVRAKVKK